MSYALTDQQKQHLAAKFAEGADPTSYAHFLIRVWEPIDYYQPGEVQRFVTAVTNFAASLEAPA